MPAFLPGPSYLALPRHPQPYVIHSILPIGGVVNLYGKSKTGKSFLGLQMSEAIANPAVHEWLTFPVSVHGPVAYFQLDTPREEWMSRLDKLKGAGMDWSNVWFADRQTGLPYPFDARLTDHVAALSKEMKHIQPLVVFVDTLREAHRGNENDSGEMMQAITNLVQATEPAALVFISHARKGSTDQYASDDVMDDQRGSNYVPGRMDTVLKLTDKKLHYKGRSCDGDPIPILKDDYYRIIADTRAGDRQRRAEEFLAANPDLTPHAAAKALSEQSTEVSLSTWRRIVKDILKVQNSPLAEAA